MWTTQHNIALVPASEYTPHHKLLTSTCPSFATTPSFRAALAVSCCLKSSRAHRSRALSLMPATSLSVSMLCLQVLMAQHCTLEAELWKAQKQLLERNEMFRALQDEQYLKVSVGPGVSGVQEASKVTALQAAPRILCRAATLACSCGASATTLNFNASERQTGSP